MKKKAIAIITTIILSISIFMDTPFAEPHGPNNIVYTPYGTCTSEFYYDSANDTHNITLGGVTIPQKGPVNLLRYTFTHPYTGTFDLDITISGILSNRWELMTSNCYLVSVVDETTLRFAVNNATYCEIAIMPQYYNNRLVLSLENQNLTPVDDTTTAVNDILTHVSYIDGQIQQIHADTTMIRNLLISMSGYSADSDDNIATDMDTLINVMKEVQYNQMYIPPHARMFMDTLTRQDVTKIQHDVYGDYVITDSNTYRMYLTANTPMLFVYEVNVTDVIPSFYSEAVTVTTLGFVRSAAVIYYAVKVESSTNGYKDFTWQYPNNKKIYPLYLGYVNTVPDEFQFIMGNYFNDAYINRLDQIKNAINNMSVNVNNLTVNATGITYNVNNTQVNNSVNNYNTDIQYVYNVENDFSTTFNTYNQQFTPDFTETMSTIQNVPSVMNDVVVDLYNLPFIKYPLLLTLAGIVLIALLGV